MRFLLRPKSHIKVIILRNFEYSLAMGAFSKHFGTATMQTFPKGHS